MKWVFIGTVVLFGAGSALCGAAPTMSALIVGRVMAGAGASGIYLGSLQYSAFLTTPARRAFAAHLLRDRTQVFLGIATATGISTLFVVVYYIPIYFQFVNNDEALMAAVCLLPFIVIAVVVNLVSGTFLHFIQLYKVIYIIASVFLIAGSGLLMVYLDPTSTTGLISGLKILVAVGSGLSMVTGYTIVTLAVKPEVTGAALSLQNASQIVGQVIALAVAS